ncbi:hypothetical protein KKG19_05240, partial [Patescibacteria group bacterium]|nr:hypothetical protein [Patescibacteria group bacterium]
MLQGLELGRELLRLLNNMASFYPVRLAQFLTGGNRERDEKQNIRFYFCFDVDGFPDFWGLRASGGESALDNADHL